MTVVLTQEVEGLNVGDEYTGPREAWLLASGYATQDGYADATPAVVAGTENAVNVVDGGDLTVQVDNEVFTITVADAATPTQVASALDTALDTVANVAVTGGKFTITSVGTGSDVYVGVVSGEGTILANLDLDEGQSARGGDSGVGTANTGPADVSVAANPEFSTTRGPIATGSELPHGATNDGITTKANPGPSWHYTG